MLWLRTIPVLDPDKVCFEGIGYAIFCVLNSDLVIDKSNFCEEWQQYQSYRSLVCAARQPWEQLALKKFFWDSSARWFKICVASFLIPPLESSSEAKLFAASSAVTTMANWIRTKSLKLSVIDPGGMGD